MSASFLRYLTILTLALTDTFICPRHELQATQTSYAPQILQYVQEDKLYLLENIRKNLSIPSEKLVVDALLTEDGPQAAYLYRKQLEEYPDPSLDNLSRSRISSFRFALNQPLAFATTVPPMAAPPTAVSKPSEKLPEAIQPDRSEIKTVKPTMAPTALDDSAHALFALQFGSFGNRDNAVKLAAQLSSYGQIAIIQDGSMHKVRLLQTWQSENQALEAARSIPFESIAVPLLQ
ncbi:MAG: SPOR domain-containing protein [Chlorobiaceae bacterium]|jgi:hypothetical protein|nr:SPOR domain-containing protein [Chlorobiaceae bacterium]